MGNKQIVIKNIQNAYFAGGCFWCTEAVFQQLKGVLEVVSGYAGGGNIKPSYEDVALGMTRHAETIKITYDPNKISYIDLVYVFLKTHDPTTLNQQGVDMGTQYRSAIFFVNESQRKEALKVIVETQEEYKDKIITEIVPLDDFFEADKYHQNFYKNNSNPFYCRIVIDPKISKLKKEFGNLTK